MSEIFDLIKKTETTHKTRSFVYPMSGADTAAFGPSQAAGAAGSDSSRRIDPEEASASGANAASPASLARYAEDEFIPAGKFTLTKATSQLQRAMDPGTILGEQFRVLRTRLSLMQKQSGIRTILITSTVPQEGKSFTSYALAGVIAQGHEKRVIIIDADMRKQGSGRDYGIGENRQIAGTAQVLQGVSDFKTSLLKSTDPEFWFLPSGILPPNPSELLSSPETEKMIRIAARNFDWVIVDAPPALALSDPTLIAPMCDTVVFVVRANSTPTKLVNETINKIGRDRICGIVLNRKKQQHSSRHYYQYYYQKQK